jgi:NADPH:quinone reductase-like Zn-dependent oxidoreductase
MRRVVRLRAPATPEDVVVEDGPHPCPGPDEVLVRVHAAAITRDELTWPAERVPQIPSYELSGVVEEIGAAVADLQTGDEVFGLTVFHRDGVAAEYTAQAATLLVARPHTLGHAESAAVPLPALTAWQGLFDHGALQAGERVLIHGAAGAVGRFAVQFARARDAVVIATASARGLADVRALGAGEALDAASWLDDGMPDADLVFDTVGGERLRRSAQALRPGARLVSVAEPPPEGGTFFIVRPERDQLRSIAGLIDDGAVRAPAVEVFPLAQARAAFARSLEPGGHGKVVLDPVRDGSSTRSVMP